MTKYVLKAETNEETVYYMNVIMMTPQKEFAQVFKTQEEAENKIQDFKNMFHYDEPKIIVEEL